MTTWIKLHDNFWRNPKVMAAGEDAATLYIQGLCFCSDGLTDGFIPTAGLRFLTTKRDAKTLAKVLVREGLWIETAKGWLVHDYAKHQRTKAEIEQIRSRAVRRASIHRNPTLKQAIRERDGDRCRYCWREVNWTNRRGSTGASYDHIEPDGPDTLDNLVVACSGCNSAKGGRNPEQAGMTLREPFRSVSSTDQEPISPDAVAVSDTYNPSPTLPSADQETDPDEPTPTPPSLVSVTRIDPSQAERCRELKANQFGAF